MSEHPQADITPAAAESQPADQVVPGGFIRRATTALTLVPLLSLGGMFVLWLRYGLDLPYRDDWREYMRGQAASLDLAHLVKSDNDTITVATRILDSLAQRYLDGNSIAYQAISMLALLGGLLALQWTMLNRLLGDRLLVACAFTTTLLMLQPGSYWGLQNMAYIQGLPLLFILLALYWILFSNTRRGIKSGLVFLAGIASGLTYISGAFSVVAAAGALLVGLLVRREARSRAFLPTLSFLVAGVMTCAVQLWVIVGVQKGQTHRADAPWALPTDGDFWFYLLGKIGRAFMFPPAMPGLSLALTVLSVAAAAVIFCLVLFRRPHPSDREADPSTQGALMLLAILGAVGVYLFMVAAGRANLRSDAITEPLQVFRFGYERFHYFWVTLLFPWLVACLMLIARRRGTRQTYAGWILLGVFVCAYSWSQGALDHNAYFKRVSERRVNLDLTCVRDSLMTKAQIHCPSMSAHRDLTPAYRYAVANNASFVRYLPPTLMAGNPNAGKFVEMLDAGAPSYSVLNAKIETREPTLRLAAGRDVQIRMASTGSLQLPDCLTLQLDATIRPETADHAQLFYQTAGNKGYSQAQSIRQPLRGREENHVSFIVTGPQGFESRLRLDPVAQSQPAEISRIAIRCLLRRSLPK